MSPPADPLLPGLPDDISARILSSLPLPHHSRLKPTSRSWRAFLSSPLALSFRPCRRGLLLVFPNDPSLSPSPHIFDPASLAWCPLPPIPCSPHRYGLSNFVTVSIGRSLFLLGGSLFDARTYPLGHPIPSAAAYRIDFPFLSWTRLPDMAHPRGSFACAASSDGEIVVAGGGSRHAMFPCWGSRIGKAEVFNMGAGRWREVEEGMPAGRAGCVGWCVDGEEEEEFWVVGGYSGYRTVGGVFPADVYCRDGAALGLKSGRWREIGDMWEAGQRRKLGPVVVVREDDDVGAPPSVFMLDGNDIFGYDIASNRWLKETTLRKKIAENESCVFLAIDGELYILTSAAPGSAADSRRPSKKRAFLNIQIYHPRNRKWRFLTTTTPFSEPLDFKTAIFCTMQL